ncbi:Cthe_2314 family HEPN domain-containing protein [Bacillus cereus]|uniref:Cthe_2314 family HEPN domain-containing protein n=1 Tax=Bacillus cereus TaxID=1396 RepID=UPI003D03A616
MAIKIKLFEFPTKEDMLPLLNESPLSGYRLEQRLFHRSDLDPMELLDYQIKLIEMISHLNNRIVQVNLSYAYVMYYFNRGIPDEVWLTSNNEGRTQYLPYLKDEHWTNKIHFEHHTDTLFQRAFTTLDLFAHILYQQFNLKRDIKSGREEDISFNRAIWKLKKQEVELHEKLLRIKKSARFEEAAQVRNDIIHNQPPYRTHTRYQTCNGVNSAQIYYITSARLREIMKGIIECIKDVFETVRLHLETNHDVRIN